MSNIKLALLSCGLGHIQRGFEVSTARWYEALQSVPGLDVRLYSGGPYAGARSCWNIPRDTLVKYLLRFLPFFSPRSRFEFAYAIEMISFAFGFFPHLLEFKPDIVWTKEAPLAHLIDMFRFDLRLPYRIIFANGGAFHPATYARFDYIQHLQPDSYRQALEWGIPASKMQVLCNLVPQIEIKESKQQLRKQWGYSNSDWIVICVGAWNKHHKRIDYLINECASAGNPHLKLLLCGHADVETNELKALAEVKLPGATRWLTLGPDDVRKAMAMSDVLVLPSIDECLGTVLIEAALHGLPIIVHPHSGALYVVNDQQWLVDLSILGNLSQRLMRFYEHPPDAASLSALRQHALDFTDNDHMIVEFCKVLDEVGGGKSSLARNVKAFG